MPRPSRLAEWREFHEQVNKLPEKERRIQALESMNKRMGLSIDREASAATPVSRHPQTLVYQLVLSKSYGGLGVVYEHNKQLDQAEAVVREAIGLQEKLVDANRAAVDYIYNLAVTYVRLSKLGPID